MLRLITMFIFISLIFIPAHAQPTNPPITPDNIHQLQQQHVFGRGYVSHIEYTPDGNYLLVDTPIGLWRYDAQDLFAEPTLTVNTGAFRGYYLGGRYMVFMQKPNILQIFDSETEMLLHEIELPDKKSFSGFSADGQYLVVSFRQSDRTHFGVIALETGQEIGVFVSATYSESLNTSENKRMVVSVAQDKGTYWVWDRENKTLSPSFTGDETIWIYDILFSPDGTRFTVNNFNYPDLYDTNTETRIKRVAPYEDFPEMIIEHTFSSDSRYIFAAGYNRSMYHRSYGTFIIDSLTGDSLDVALGSASDLTVTPNNRYIVTSIHRDFSFFTVNTWYEMETWDKTFELKGVRFLTHPYRDDVILYDDSIQRYGFTSQTPLEDVILHHLEIQESDIFSPDDRLLLTYSRDAYLWDTQTGELVHRLAVNTDSRSVSFHFSLDGQYLINSTYTGEITVWNTNTGQLLYTVINAIEDEWGSRYHLGMIGREYPDSSFYYPYQNPSFSPDSHHFISTLVNFLYLRDTQTGELIHQERISEGDKVVYQARFNPSGTHIVTISEADEWLSGTIHWWDIATWTGNVVVENVRVAVISPDAGHVAYGLENEIWLLNTLTGENRLLTDSYRTTITHLRFSEDGQFLYSEAEGEVSKWWDVETGAFITSDYHIGIRNRPLELWSCQDNDVTVYCMIDTRTQEPIFLFTEHVGNIAYAQFNHAGTQIVTDGLDGTIRLWGIGD